MAYRLETQIAKLKRNQERRIDRKNKKIAKEGGELLVASPSIKSETTRKCGNCGDVGHMSRCCQTFRVLSLTHS